MKTLAKLANKFFENVCFAEIPGTACPESDRQCFIRALNQFLSSGDKSDAFCVYFCFSEIFKLFGKG